MKMSLRFVASSALLLIAVTACFGQRYTRTNLVSNLAGVARITDPQFISPWGMSRSSGSAWWVADQRTGSSTAYNGAGVKQPLRVFIPACDPNNESMPAGTPTGVIFNGEQNDFLLAAGKPAVFLFSTIDGTIAAWNPNVAVDQGTAAPSTHAVTVIKTTDGSSYTGLTSAFIDGKLYLYAANFSNGRVDVYDNAFHQVTRSGDDPGSLRRSHCGRATRSGYIYGDCWNDQNYFSENSFVDESLPRPYAPFNVQAIGNNIAVTYAVRQEQVSRLEMDGPGLGFVDIYNSTGQLLLRLEHGDWLNAPWGVALAPSDFGRFSHNLLIGQFAGGGDTQSSGYIAAYDLSTGKFNGLLQDADGKPLAIKGVLALGSGNAGPNDSDSTAVPAAGLFFTAASSYGFGGLFGYVAAVSTVDRLAEASRLTSRSATNIHAQISSIPAGADIQVDGAYVGATPSDIELSCCWHDVTIRKAGRKPWTRRVRFADRALKITAHLQK